MRKVYIGSVKMHRFFFALFLLFSAGCDSWNHRALKKIVDAHGGREAFYRLRNVCYRLRGKPKARTRQLVLDFEKEEVRVHPVDPTWTTYRMKREFYLFAFVFKFLDQGVRGKDLGEMKLDGKTYRAYGILHRDDRFQILVDPKTFRLAWIALDLDETVPEGPLWMKVEMEEVSGVWIPRRRHFFRRNGEALGEDLRLEESIDRVAFWCENQDFQTR